MSTPKRIKYRGQIYEAIQLKEDNEQQQSNSIFVNVTQIGLLSPQDYDDWGYIGVPYSVKEYHVNGKTYEWWIAPDREGLLYVKDDSAYYTLSNNKICAVRPVFTVSNFDFYDHGLEQGSKVLLGENQIRCTVMFDSRYHGELIYDDELIESEFCSERLPHSSQYQAMYQNGEAEINKVLKQKFDQYLGE